MTKDMYKKREERKNKFMGEKTNTTNINWYPGHMVKTKKELAKIMPVVDIIYEIVDARIPYSSKIRDIDSIIKNKNRILIMTKKDLCDITNTNIWVKYYENMGYKVLLLNLNDNNDYKKVINLTEEISKSINEKRIKNGLKEKEIKSCVIGIPNVGKSTLINKLAGKKVANTGNKPGVTKNNVWLKTKYRLLVLDTPGILWPRIDEEKVGFNLAAMSAINEDILPLKEVAQYILMTLEKYYPEILLNRFKIAKYDEDAFDIIAKNISAISKDVIDYHKVYKMIINEIKLEHVKGITFDRSEKC